MDAPDDPTQASLAGRRRSNSPGIATYADGRSSAFVLSLSHHKGRGHCRAESHHIFGSISERCCRPSMSPVVCAARLGDPDGRTRAAARLYRARFNTAPQQIPLNAMTTAGGTSRRLSHAYTAVAALARSRSTSRKTKSRSRHFDHAQPRQVADNRRRASGR